MHICGFALKVGFCLKSLLKNGLLRQSQENPGNTFFITELLSKNETDSSLQPDEIVKLLI